jgi:hypothetical protein
MWVKDILRVDDDVQKTGKFSLLDIKPTLRF